ncbi:uncharacterized protein LOC123551467 [Mercenaria mercenaria]|uniref:uncharacterized protein LOC123551467 n=1 Tax=Mercenaria mercenaria TaxID=6596 RepID=UPI001E1D2237|nr:uncharacterized protein LOC123551467 [Mercenaria mercenaria]XP_045196363.1 uncharacterized protein LOC123551467 [Mercenaria mercenaria]XP_045196364.1 uncharacterized protein LOC123551467 [Mercenaria mercenaria]
MSVQVESENLPPPKLNGQMTDSYGLPVQESTPRGLHSRPMVGSPSKPAYGVRVPVLKDLDGHFLGRKQPAHCRFDIVEKITTVIKPGAYGLSQNEHDTAENNSPKTSEGNSIKRVTVTRQPTFHSTYSNFTKQDDQKDSSVLEKIGPYHWNTWVKSGKEGDARDVLYKNTYCQVPEQVRYRTLTLPRISTSSSTERPWTVAGDEKPVVTKSDHGEYNKVVTIVPQQPRGTVVRFREYMKPATYSSDGRPLAVKSYNTRPVQYNHFTTISDGFPLIRHDFRRSPKKTERPLKFENSRYTKKSKDTLFSKHILPAYKQAFDRDYSSADTFKEYLDCLQQTAKANTPGMHTRDIYGHRNSETRQPMDYHNEVLKSVSDVNQPEEDIVNGDPHEISVDIRKQQKPETELLDCIDGQKPPVIDNLSSVHGSVVRAHSDTQSVTVPRSSSIVDGKSVVKIPSVVSEAANSVAQNVIPESKLPQVEEDGSHCPANTPTPGQEL